MQKWEYAELVYDNYDDQCLMFHYTDEGAEKLVDEKAGGKKLRQIFGKQIFLMGNDGWELMTSVVNQWQGGYFGEALYFKRPLEG